MRRLTTVGLLVASGAVVAFVGYWWADAATTEAWFRATLLLMLVGLVLGVVSFLLARRRHAPRTAARAVMLLSLSPVGLLVLILLATWGFWAVEALWFRLLGVGS
jgi:hypothetical protein